MRYDPQFLSSALFDEKPHHQKAMGYPRSSFKYIPPVHNSLSHTHIPSRFSQLKLPSCKTAVTIQSSSSLKFDLPSIHHPEQPCFAHAPKERTLTNAPQNKPLRLQRKPIRLVHRRHRGISSVIYMTFKGTRDSTLSSARLRLLISRDVY